MPRNNTKVVPEARNAIDRMKYEIAAEFGLPVGYGSSGSTHGFADTEFSGEFGTGAVSSTSSWGHLTSRENGSVGGEITKRLVGLAQQQKLL